MTQDNIPAHWRSIHKVKQYDERRWVLQLQRVDGLPGLFIWYALGVGLLVWLRGYLSAPLLFEGAVALVTVVALWGAFLLGAKPYYSFVFPVVWSWDWDKRTCTRTKGLRKDVYSLDDLREVRVRQTEKVEPGGGGEGSVGSPSRTRYTCVVSVSHREHGEIPLTFGESTRWDGPNRDGPSLCGADLAEKLDIPYESK